MVNKAKVRSESDGDGYLRDTFEDVEEGLKHGLEAHERGITHDGLRGDETEDAWLRLLRSRLPRRYEVAKAIVLDVTGATSQQQDCVIFDAFYTPIMRGWENFCYVPAEAVYAVFEIKPAINASTFKYAEEKITSVRELKRTATEFKGEAKRQKRTPQPIIGGMLAKKTDWVDGLGESFDRLWTAPGNASEQLDFAITLEAGFVERMPGGKTIKHSHRGASVRGLFRLVSRLRDTGTVAAVDLDAYSEAAWRNSKN